MALLVERREHSVHGPELTFCQKARVVDVVAAEICSELGLASGRLTSLEIAGTSSRTWLVDELKPMRNGRVLDRPPSRKLRSTYAHVLSGFFAYPLAQGWIDQVIATFERKMARRALGGGLAGGGQDL
jgi:hypothetical protein